MMRILALLLGYHLGRMLVRSAQRPLEELCDLTYAETAAARLS